MYEMYISIRSVDPNFSNSDHIHHHLFFEGDTVSLQLLTFTGKGENQILVGGFNPFEKYWSTWIISPSRVETTKYLKPPATICTYNGWIHLFCL